MAHDADRVLFAHVVDRPEEEIQLDVAALLLGEWAHPGLDVVHYVGLLDRFAERVEKARDEQEPAPFRGIRALNHVLFDTLGFRGNEDDYYDPRNSFLNEVMDRRVGIPISLTVIYMEVGRRVGLDVRGLAFPGHFLARYDEGDEALVIDPFHGGISLDEDDLNERLERMYGDEAELTAELLEPASKKQILRRMLTNLASIYRKRGDGARVLEVLERIAVLEPTDELIARELAELRRRVGQSN